MKPAVQARYDRVGLLRRERVSFTAATPLSTGLTDRLITHQQLRRRHTTSAALRDLPPRKAHDGVRPQHSHG